jgi:hypothetical protein
METIDTFTTKELVNEILRRTEAGLIVLVLPPDDDYQGGAVAMTGSGPLSHRAGLAFYANEMMKKACIAGSQPMDDSPEYFQFDEDPDDEL